jgi:Zn-finger domain-containing protein
MIEKLEQIEKILDQIKINNDDLPLVTDLTKLLWEVRQELFDMTSDF